MTFENWLLFASIAFMATITPGPAILIVSTHSMTYGTKASIATMIGNVSGLFILSLFSVLGLSALILNSVALFYMIKIIGAGYLILLGIRLWRSGFGFDVVRLSKTENLPYGKRIVRLYLNGLLVALSNPKAIVFTMALFPQFVEPAGPIVPQFAILIMTFMTLSFACLFAYAVMAARIQRSSAHIGLSGFLGKTFGVAFVGFGIYLASVSQK